MRFGKGCLLACVNIVAGPTVVGCLQHDKASIFEEKSLGVCAPDKSDYGDIVS